MSMNKILDSVFKDFLDGKSGKVFSEGLYVQGSEGGRVKFRHTPTGLQCLGELRFNDENILASLQEELNESRESLKLSFDTRDQLNALMQEVIDNASVIYATISTWDVQSFETTTDDNGDIATLSITYRGGSQTRITDVGV